MCKLSDFNTITTGIYKVLNLNGEGADATISRVDGVSILATQVCDDFGECDGVEWTFEAIYHDDPLASCYGRCESAIRVQESVITSDFNEFVSEFTRFINGINDTSLATRLGFYALSVYGMTEADVRSLLLVNYGVTE